MRRIRILLVAWGMLLLGSGAWACGASPTEAERIGLIGGWEWIRATGGIAGVQRTPESEGHTFQLRFEADGSVELRRDHALQVRTTYELLPPSEEPGALDHRRIRYGEPVLGVEWQHLVEADAGGLVLADPCCDLFVWEFRPAG